MPLTDDAGRPLKVFKGLMDTLDGRMTAWGPDHARIEMDVSDRIRNGIDVVHGGVMAALIDTAGAHAGIFCPAPGRTRQAMTVSLNVNLLGNVSDGVLIADARVLKAGKTIFVSACDVTDGEGNLLATGQVVGRYGRGSHLAEGVEVPKTGS
ncbi:MAG: PaaI family thioesterase [Alphaproteobacteria bacterium]